jgi:GNAT superfamily N-acetyltransferase
MAAETFQYPDHPEWSVQADELESIAASMKNYRRMWPVIRLLQSLSPALRHILHGHIWEEDGQIVGFTNINRRGTTDVWYISGVGVRPDYRRRGIARQLVSASLDMIREHGGRIALLDVIDGNEPAYKLYQSLGFETYAGTLMLELEPQSAPSPSSLPAGYVQKAVSLFEWRSRYRLAQRITPEHVRTYEPVEERRYRRSPMARLMMPLLLKADGLKAECFVIRTSTGQVVAHGRSEARVREKGRNEIHGSLDPAHAELAPFLVQFLLHRVTSLSPDRIVEMNLPERQSALFAAAKEAGFERRIRNQRMGLLLPE